MNVRSVAVIDDEPAILQFVAEVAQAAGFEPLCSTDAQEFLRNVVTRSPIVVMIDLRMPGTDGIELLRELASLRCESKIILFSGMDSRVVETALVLGRERGLQMAGSIAKPLRIKDLRALLTTAASPALTVDAESIRAALANEELLLHYLPRLELRSRRITGVEALVRWRPKGHDRLIMPGEFIPAAEAAGLIGGITQWVFEAAIAQCGRWQREGLRLDVSINLSARDVVDEFMPDWIVDLCSTHSVAPERITVELTETAAMLNPLLVLEVLTRFRVKGFSLGIDDFGTGYSSLVQLQRLPFSELKIDRSFVSAMAQSRDCAVIVRTIAGMARNLGLRCVAEGVEDLGLLDELQELGCDYAQGFAIARPTDAEQVSSMLFAQAAGSI